MKTDYLIWAVKNKQDLSPQERTEIANQLSKRTMNKALLLLILIPIVLYLIGEYLSCYYMIGGSSDWCERLL